MGFWDFFWLMVWTFVFVMYLMLLFQIFRDLFRDKTLSGWAKALWIIGLIVLPYLMALIYVIARGRGMGERQAGEIRQAQAETDQYIKSVANTQSTAADQITAAKALLDQGAISEGEYDQLKAKALV
jgi:hypothetical protein